MRYYEVPPEHFTVFRDNPHWTGRHDRCQRLTLRTNALRHLWPLKWETCREGSDGSLIPNHLRLRAMSKAR